MIRLQLKATIDTLVMKPKDYQEHGDPSSGLGYNYLYEIIGLGDYVEAFRDIRLAVSYTHLTLPTSDLV